MTKRGPLFLPVALLFALSGCASSSPPEIGSETNWLRQCSANADCDSAGSCVCGICSQRCSVDADCSPGLVCQPAESALVQSACGSAAVFGLCSPECTASADCGSKQSCIEDACAPAGAAVPAAVDAGDGAPPQAYVVSAVAPDSSCVYANDNPITAHGLLDISTGGTRDSTGCEQSYRLHLKVVSNEPGVLQLSGASVQLMTRDQETLLFDSEDPPVANPFNSIASSTLIPAADSDFATGIVEVEAVRVDHQKYLSDFVGDQILAAIRLQGSDASDAPITFRPFLFPIEICDGCLTACASSYGPGAPPVTPTREDLVGDRCNDNSGSDGRFCFDPGC